MECMLKGIHSITEMKIKRNVEDYGLPNKFTTLIIFFCCKINNRVQGSIESSSI